MRILDWIIRNWTRTGFNRPRRGHLIEIVGWSGDVCTRVAPALNQGRDADYPQFDFSCFSSVLSRKWSDIPQSKSPILTSIEWSRHMQSFIEIELYTLKRGENYYLHPRVMYRFLWNHLNENHINGREFHGDITCRVWSKADKKTRKYERITINAQD